MSRSMWYLLFSLIVIPLGLALYRRDYRRWGRTRITGVVAVSLCLLMPNLALWRAGPFPPALAGPLDYAGLLAMALALVLLVMAMRPFRSSRMLLGTEQPFLVRDGFFRWSRNPQYVFWGVLLAGYALMVNTPTGWIAIVVYMAMIRGVVHVEEEHLEKAFGDDYRNFKREVPRFVRIPPSAA